LAAKIAHEVVVHAGTLQAGGWTLDWMSDDDSHSSPMAPVINAQLKQTHVNIYANVKLVILNRQTVHFKTGLLDFNCGTERRAWI